MGRQHVVGEQGRVETLSNGPIPTVEFQHHGIGTPSQGDTGMPSVIGTGEGQTPREMVDVLTAAPVVGDATVQRGPERDEEVAKIPPPKRYRILATKQILDQVSQTRTTLREGKEISEQQYSIRALQQQGVRLQDITDVDPHAPLPVL